MLTSTRLDLYQRFRQGAGGDRADAPYLCPTSEYTSHEQLRREREILFRQTPIVVALSADIGLPGSAYSADIDGIPLLVLRDNDGTARVFVNACRHRGARLFEGREKVARTLVCPYHAWCYHLDGTLSRRPQAEPCYTGIDPETLGLRQLPSDESLGLIFARLDGAGPVDATDCAGALGAELAAYGLGTYAHIETRWHTGEFNWKLGLDTFLESYHVFSLHRKSISEYITSDSMVFKPLGLHQLTMTPWKSMDTQASGPDDILQYSTIQHVLFPNMIITHQLDHIETWNFFPDRDDPARCLMRTSLYAPREPQSEKELGHWHRNMEVLINLITGEDFPQCRNIQVAAASGAAAKDYLFGQNEPSLIHFHQALHQALAGPRSTPTTPPSGPLVSSEP